MARGCELQAILDSAVKCGTSGSAFNYTKYESYITLLVKDGSGEIIYNIYNILCAAFF